jgi:hypothetical protein
MLDRRGAALALSFLLGCAHAQAGEYDSVVTGAAGLAALSDSLCADSLHLPHQLSFVEAVLAATKHHDAGDVGARIIDRSLFDGNLRRHYFRRQVEIQEALDGRGTEQCDMLARVSWQQVRSGLNETGTR